MFPSIQFLLLFWTWLLYVGSLRLSFCVGNANLGCLERERQALIKFKKGLRDPSSRLSSWVGEDCCKWTGIRCDNRSGQVVRLDLRNPYRGQISLKEVISDSYSGLNSSVAGNFKRSCISGEINPSLLELKYLSHLDLSKNDFGGMPIPKFIGSFSKLRYLNLSGAGFGGRVPHELGNLSALSYLDLNRHTNVWLDLNGVGSYPLMDFDFVTYELRVDSLDWVSHLSSLQHLDLGGLNLSMAADWLLPLNMLASISSIHLSDCSLPSIYTSLPHMNLTSLSTLDLSDNNLGPMFPIWLFNVSRTKSLSLEAEDMRDPIPATVGNLCNIHTLNLQGNSFNGDINRFQEYLRGCIEGSLEELYLGNNGLSGHLPEWLGKFTNLKSLHLDQNTLSGQIPASLGRLSFLRELDLQGNNLSGSIPPSLGRLSSLRFLYLSTNNLSGSIPSSFGKLSALQDLDLLGNQMNGSIPESLGQLSNLTNLRIERNSFEGVLSESHFSNLKKLKVLLMGHNSLILNVSSNWVPPFQLMSIRLDDCKIGPHFPSWLQTQTELLALSLSNTRISDIIPTFLWNFSSNIFFIDLSNNSISGSIISSFGEATNLIYLSLSSNQLNGSIPSSICKMSLLSDLHLSNNHLSGEIPQCLGDLQFLSVLSMENNNLSRYIPNSIGQLFRLQSLHLRKNKLSGELPPSLKNCTALVTLDLGENRLSGKIPKWIGERLLSLKFLILRSNKFHGNLPPHLSLLSKLQVLDLAQNNISGTIPASFGNFVGMIVAHSRHEIILDIVVVDDESISVLWRGREDIYESILPLMVIMDLSCNNLSGQIPKEIAHLVGLKGLNLSANYFTGSIPEKIGDMQQMESLDLSINMLSGAIPESLSDITFLSHLNLSFNNLSGRIPSGKQLDVLDDSSIYIGNPNLYGKPLPYNCIGDGTHQDPQRIIDDGEIWDRLKIQLFYISIAAGFAVGFWTVCGILLLKKSWRIAYYQFFDDIGNKLYVTIATWVAKFQAKGIYS